MKQISILVAIIIIFVQSFFSYTGVQFLVLLNPVFIIFLLFLKSKSTVLAFFYLISAIFIIEKLTLITPVGIFLLAVFSALIIVETLRKLNILFSLDRINSYYFFVLNLSIALYFIMLQIVIGTIKIESFFMSIILNNLLFLTTIYFFDKFNKKNNVFEK